MFNVLVLVIAAICGLFWGALLKRTRIPRIVQDFGAMVVGWILGVVLALAGVVWRLSLGTASGGIGAVSFGFAESSLLGVIVSALVAIALRFTLRRVGSEGRGIVAANVPLILGTTGALLGALWALLHVNVAG